jgi:hypothetical protein
LNGPAQPLLGSKHKATSLQNKIVIKLCSTPECIIGNEANV